MTALDTDSSGEPRPDDLGDDDQPGGEVGTRPRRRRRPAPRANLFFRFVFPFLVILGGAAVFLLWVEGTKAVLDSTDGQELAVVTDPAEAGYLAFVEPTPTLLIAHVDGNDTLVGVTVLAQTALDEGGSLVVLSPDLIIDDGSGEGVVLGEIYRDEGAAGLERLVGSYFGFGFTDETMVMDPSLLEDWLSLVEPVPFLLADDLVELDADGVEQVVVAAGPSSFDAATLATIFGWRNHDEVDAQRFERQHDIWSAWIGQVGESDDLIAATTAFESGLPAYLRAMGAGTADIALAPMRPAGFDPQNPIYGIDPEWGPEKAREMVPLPTGATPGARTTVQLLDGTGDPTVRDAQIPVLVDAGAQVVVIGNAIAFGVPRSSVAYHRVEDAAAAESIAAALGLAAEFVDDSSQPAQVTVTIGLDMGAE